MANTITFLRIAVSIVLLFCPVFSPAFYVFYIVAGVSDMLDGFVARKTNTANRFGARLDTIADFVLVVVCLIKLLPILSIPAWLYIWIGIIALIKAEEVCGCSFGYEQSNWRFTVSVTADDSRSSAERLCYCHLCGSNVRRNSGRPFHQNRKRIEKETRSDEKDRRSESHEALRSI